jgi:hypothetical protein
MPKSGIKPNILFKLEETRIISSNLLIFFQKTIQELKKLILKNEMNDLLLEKLETEISRVVLDCIP